MALHGASLRLALFRARFKHFTGTGSAGGGAAGRGLLPVMPGSPSAGPALMAA